MRKMSPNCVPVADILANSKNGDWQSPSAIARLLGWDDETTSDILCELDLGGWTDIREDNDSIKVKLRSGYRELRLAVDKPAVSEVPPVVQATAKIEVSAKVEPEPKVEAVAVETRQKELDAQPKAQRPRRTRWSRLYTRPRRASWLCQPAGSPASANATR